MKDSYLSVVVPVYNEKNNIVEIMDKLLALGFIRELIVVDDGSTDGTKELLKAYQPNPRIKLILHERNLGKGASVKDGFAAAVGEILVIQDADFEYKPEELSELTAPILNGEASIVYGARFTSNKPCKVYFMNRLGNKLLTFLTNLLYGSRLSDMETCYKVYKRSVLEEIKIESKGFSVEPELTAKVLKLGYKIYELPISYTGRSYDEGKKIRWFHGISAVSTLIKYRFVG